METPINNYEVGKKLRDIANVQAFQAVLTDKVNPSIIINPSGKGAEVQPSFPKPNSNQRLRYTTYRQNGAIQRNQIATVTSNTNVYLLGVVAFQQSATADTICLFDAVTGNAMTPTANTVYQDELGRLLTVGLTATTGNILNVFLPLPVKVTAGIRLECGVAGTVYDMVIFWIEETI